MIKFIKKLFSRKSGFQSVQDGLPNPYTFVIVKHYENDKSIPMLIDCYRITDFNADVNLVDYWHCTCGTMKDKIVMINYKDSWKYVGIN